MNLTDANYHWRNSVDCIIDTWSDKTLQAQKCTFSEKESKKLKIGFELQGCLRPL